MQKKILIIGAGDAGKMVIQEMLDNRKIADKYNITGILDDDPVKHRVLGIPVLGKISEAGFFIKKYSIEEVIVAIPSASHEVINNIINSLVKTNVHIKIIPGIYEIIEGKASFNQIRDFVPEDLLGREEIGFNIDQISDYYKDKTVFVTGAGGSIGSEIFMQLLELPVKKVIAFGHGENSIHNLIMKIGKEKRFGYVIGDVKDKIKIEYEIGKYKPDIVFHAAAHKHVPLMEDYPDEAVKNNIFGTYNTAVASIKNNVKKFILVSTDKAVNPTSVMGCAKKIAEKIILSLNNIQSTTGFSLTRFGNVLGSRGSVIHIFREAIEKRLPITITDPEITRFFMSIREASRLVIKSGTITKGRIFILDMGKPVKILDLARQMIKIYGYDPDEFPIVFTGLRPGEKMYEEVLTEKEDIEKSTFEKLFISKENEKLLTEKEIDDLLANLSNVCNTFDNQKIIEDIKNIVFK